MSFRWTSRARMTPARFQVPNPGRTNRRRFSNGSIKLS